MHSTSTGPQQFRYESSVPIHRSDTCIPLAAHWHHEGSTPSARSHLDAMSEQQIRRSLVEHSRRVDHACRTRWGFGIMVWRALDALVSLGALALAGYAIVEGAPPFPSLFLAAIIISGPKVAEWWLVKEDVIEFNTTRRENSRDTDE